jgi:hypothetical protein
MSTRRPTSRSVPRTRSVGLSAVAAVVSVAAAVVLALTLASSPAVAWPATRVAAHGRAGNQLVRLDSTVPSRQEAPRFDLRRWVLLLPQIQKPPLARCRLEVR